MKKIFSLITTIFIFFNVANAETINECKTDIYFGNGVWNTYKQANEGREALAFLIKRTIINGDPKLKAKYGEVKLQYNWGQGRMLDLLETYYQLKESGQMNDTQFFTLVDILLKNAYVKAGTKLSNEAIKTFMDVFTRGWEEGNVDEMWEKYYRESFKLSHQVLLVSHSQGGLFANRVYDKISPTGYKNYFANLQVASPASEVKALKGDYVTLSTDLTSVDPVVNFIPGSMSPNVSGDSGHKFIPAYLSQNDPLTKIIKNIKELLANLDTEPSQWQTDQEFERDTINYRITVKHLFDPNIVMNNKVYPFAPSEKLYQAKDEVEQQVWVKASCGGKIIKRTSEYYVIDNPQQEKIIGEEKFNCNNNGRYSNYDAREDGYHIIETACNYSIASGGITHVWNPVSGFYNIAGGSPSYNYFNQMRSSYDNCLYPQWKTKDIGSDCYCYECTVYWEK